MTSLSWGYLQKIILQNMITRDLQDNFYHPTKTLDVIFLSFFSFFKDRFCCRMVKQRNFLHVVDLSFDARFVKHYQFSLHYHKQCPINNIKVKYLQIGCIVSNIFWTCSLRIVSDKLRELLISSFWPCDSDFW